MAYSETVGTPEEQNFQPNSMEMHDDMDTDMPASANGAVGGTPPLSQSEGPADMNGRGNGETTLDNQLDSETETQAPSTDGNGMPRESDVKEDTKSE